MAIRSAASARAGVDIWGFFRRVLWCVRLRIDEDGYGSVTSFSEGGERYRRKGWGGGGGEGKVNVARA